jgi:hypothetical protein
MPPAPFCTCVKYCLLVVFHAAMYRGIDFKRGSREDGGDWGLGWFVG